MSGCKTDCEVSIDDPEVAVVLRGPLADVQRAADRLGDRGIDSAIVRPEADSKGCCGTTMTLVVAREDAPAAWQVFDAEWKRGLSPEQIAALEAAANIVIDPDAPETTCPACLFTFETGPSSCPDCGLAM